MHPHTLWGAGEGAGGSRQASDVELLRTNRDKPGKHSTKPETPGCERKDEVASAPVAPPSPQLRQLGPTPLRIGRWGQKGTLGDPPQQLFRHWWWLWPAGYHIASLGQRESEPRFQPVARVLSCDREASSSPVSEKSLF